MKILYDLKDIAGRFSVGEKVWLYNPKRTKGRSPKLQKSWEGWYTVVTRLKDLVYRIGRSPLSKMKAVHLDRLTRLVRTTIRTSKSSTTISTSEQTSLKSVKTSMVQEVRSTGEVETMSSIQEQANYTGPKLYKSDEKNRQRATMDNNTSTAFARSTNIYISNKETQQTEKIETTKEKNTAEAMETETSGKLKHTSKFFENTKTIKSRNEEATSTEINESETMETTTGLLLPELNAEEKSTVDAVGFKSESSENTADRTISKQETPFSKSNKLKTLKPTTELLDTETDVKGKEGTGVTVSKSKSAVHKNTPKAKLDKENITFSGDSKLENLGTNVEEKKGTDVTVAWSKSEIIIETSTRKFGKEESSFSVSGELETTEIIETESNLEEKEETSNEALESKFETPKNLPITKFSKEKSTFRKGGELKTLETTTEFIVTESDVEENIKTTAQYGEEEVSSEFIVEQSDVADKKEATKFAIEKTNFVANEKWQTLKTTTNPILSTLNVKEKGGLDVKVGSQILENITKIKFGTEETTFTERSGLETFGTTTELVEGKKRTGGLITESKPKVLENTARTRFGTEDTFNAKLETLKISTVTETGTDVDETNVKVEGSESDILQKEETTPSRSEELETLTTTTELLDTDFGVDEKEIVENSETTKFLKEETTFNERSGLETFATITELIVKGKGETSGSIAESKPKILENTVRTKFSQEDNFSGQLETLKMTTDLTETEPDIKEHEGTSTKVAESKIVHKEETAPSGSREVETTELLVSEFSAEEKKIAKDTDTTKSIKEETTSSEGDQLKYLETTMDILTTGINEKEKNDTGIKDVVVKSSRMFEKEELESLVTTVKHSTKQESENISVLSKIPLTKEPVHKHISPTMIYLNDTNTFTSELDKYSVSKELYTIMAKNVEDLKFICDACPRSTTETATKMIANTQSSAVFSEKVNKQTERSRPTKHFKSGYSNDMYFLCDPCPSPVKRVKIKNNMSPNATVEEPIKLILPKNIESVTGETKTERVITTSPEKVTKFEGSKETSDNTKEIAKTQKEFVDYHISTNKPISEDELKQITEHVSYLSKSNVTVLTKNISNLTELLSYQTGSSKSTEMKQLFQNITLGQGDLGTLFEGQTFKLRETLSGEKGKAALSSQTTTHVIELTTEQEGRNKIIQSSKSLSDDKSSEISELSKSTLTKTESTYEKQTPIYNKEKYNETVKISNEQESTELIKNKFTKELQTSNVFKGTIIVEKPSLNTKSLQLPEEMTEKTQKMKEQTKTTNKYIEKIKKINREKVEETLEHLKTTKYITTKSSSEKNVTTWFKFEPTSANTEQTDQVLEPTLGQAELINLNEGSKLLLTTEFPKETRANLEINLTVQSQSATMYKKGATRKFADWYKEYPENEEETSLNRQEHTNTGARKAISHEFTENDGKKTSGISEDFVTHYIELETVKQSENSLTLQKGKSEATPKQFTTNVTLRYDQKQEVTEELKQNEYKEKISAKSELLPLHTEYGTTKESYETAEYDSKTTFYATTKEVKMEEISGQQQFSEFTMTKENLRPLNGLDESEKVTTRMNGQSGIVGNFTFRYDVEEENMMTSQESTILNQPENHEQQISEEAEKVEITLTASYDEAGNTTKMSELKSSKVSLGFVQYEVAKTDSFKITKETSHCITDIETGPKTQFSEETNSVDGNIESEQYLTKSEMLETSENFISTEYDSKIHWINETDNKKQSKESFENHVLSENPLTNKSTSKSKELAENIVTMEEEKSPNELGIFSTDLILEESSVVTSNEFSIFKHPSTSQIEETNKIIEKVKIETAYDKKEDEESITKFNEIIDSRQPVTEEKIFSKYSLTAGSNLIKSSSETKTKSADLKHSIVDGGEYAISINNATQESKLRLSPMNISLNNEDLEQIFEGVKLTSLIETMPMEHLEYISPLYTHSVYPTIYQKGANKMYTKISAEYSENEEKGELISKKEKYMSKTSELKDNYTFIPEKKNQTPVNAKFEHNGQGKKEKTEEIFTVFKGTTMIVPDETKSNIYESDITLNNEGTFLAFKSSTTIMPDNAETAREILKVATFNKKELETKEYLKVQTIKTAESEYMANTQENINTALKHITVSITNETESSNEFAKILTVYEEGLKTSDKLEEIQTVTSAESKKKTKNEESTVFISSTISMSQEAESSHEIIDELKEIQTTNSVMYKSMEKTEEVKTKETFTNFKSSTIVKPDEAGGSVKFTGVVNKEEYKNKELHEFGISENTHVTDFHSHIAEDKKIHTEHPEIQMSTKVKSETPHLSEANDEVATEGETIKTGKKSEKTAEATETGQGDEVEKNVTKSSEGKTSGESLKIGDLTSVSEKSVESSGMSISPKALDIPEIGSHPTVCELCDFEKSSTSESEHRISVESTENSQVTNVSDKEFSETITPEAKTAKSSEKINTAENATEPFGETTYTDTEYILSDKTSVETTILGGTTEISSVASKEPEETIIAESESGNTNALNDDLKITENISEQTAFDNTSTILEGVTKLSSASTNKAEEKTGYEGKNETNSLSKNLGTTTHASEEVEQATSPEDENETDALSQNLSRTEHATAKLDQTTGPEGENETDTSSQKSRTEHASEKVDETTGPEGENETDTLSQNLSTTNNITEKVNQTTGPEGENETDTLGQNLSTIEQVSEKMDQTSGPEGESETDTLSQNLSTTEHASDKVDQTTVPEGENETGTLSENLSTTDNITEKVNQTTGPEGENETDTLGQNLSTIEQVSEKIDQTSGPEGESETDTLNQNLSTTEHASDKVDQTTGPEGENETGTLSENLSTTDNITEKVNQTTGPEGENETDTLGQNLSTIEQVSEKIDQTSGPEGESETDILSQNLSTTEHASDKVDQTTGPEGDNETDTLSQNLSTTDHVIEKVNQTIIPKGENETDTLSQNLSTIEHVSEEVGQSTIQDSNETEKASEPISGTTNKGSSGESVAPSNKLDNTIILDNSAEVSSHSTGVASNAEALGTDSEKSSEASKELGMTESIGSNTEFSDTLKSTLQNSDTEEIEQPTQKEIMTILKGSHNESRTSNDELSTVSSPANIYSEETSATTSLSRVFNQTPTTNIVNAKTTPISTIALVGTSELSETQSVTKIFRSSSVEPSASSSHESSMNELKEISMHKKLTHVSTKNLPLPSTIQIDLGLVDFQSTPCEYCHSESTVLINIEQSPSPSSSGRTIEKGETTLRVSKKEEIEKNVAQMTTETQPKEEKSEIERTTLREEAATFKEKKKEREKTITEIKTSTDILKKEESLETEYVHNTPKPEFKETEGKNEKEGKEVSTILNKVSGQTSNKHTALLSSIGSANEEFSTVRVSQIAQEHSSVEQKEKEIETTITKEELEISTTELPSTTEVDVGVVGFETTPCEYCHDKTKGEKEHTTNTKLKLEETEVSKAELEEGNETEEAEGSEEGEEEQDENDGKADEEKTEQKIGQEQKKEEKGEVEETKKEKVSEEKEKGELQEKKQDEGEIEKKKEEKEKEDMGQTIGEQISESDYQGGTSKEAAKVVHKQVVIVVNNSGNKLSKLNQTILEEVLSSPINNLDLHYIDINAENDSSKIVTKNEPLRLSVPYESCKRTDYVDGKNCLCNIQTYMDTLLKKINHKETIKSKGNYCNKFLKLKNGLLIENSLKPIKRRRRGLIYLESLKRKGEHVEYETIEGLFENEYKLMQDTDANLFSLPGETVKIRCTTYNKEQGMSWKFRPNFSSKDELLLDKGHELVIHSVSVKNSGNYTCSREDEKNIPEKQHWHELELITFPIYDINMNVFYKINDSCSLRTGDVLYSYLPKIVGPILCSNDNEVCLVDLERPRCLTREDDNYFNVTMKAKISSDFITTLHDNCDINCKLRVYENLVTVIYKNCEIFQHIPVYSKLEASHTIEFLPNINGREGSPVTIKEPKIIVFCPGGFGLESKHQSVCVACPSHTFSGDEEAFCKRCPGGQYQPEPGSKSCIQCNSPVDNEMCLRMLYTDTKLFKIYVGVAFGFIVLMVIIVIVWTSGYKDNEHVKNSYFEGSLRHRAITKRRDPDLETGVREPLLGRSSKKPTPPQLPPVDF